MTTDIPDATIDALARSIFKEASAYGFEQVDVIRLINELMEMCIDSDGPANGSVDDNPPPPPSGSDDATDLPLVGKRVIVRAFNGKEDARFLEQWLPEKYGRFFVLSSATAQSITIDALTNSPDNHLGIITLLDDRPIGAMAFLDHSKKQKRAELRKLIGDLDSRGEGLAEEATRLWIKYGVSALGLEKIYVSTLQTQFKNIKLNERIGFRVEGLLRNEVLIDGARNDVLRMGFCVE